MNGVREQAWLTAASVLGPRQGALGLLVGRQRADALAVRGAPRWKAYPRAAAAPLRDLWRRGRRRWCGLLGCLGLWRRRRFGRLRRLCSLLCVCTTGGESVDRPTVGSSLSKKAKPPEHTLARPQHSNQLAHGYDVVGLHLQATVLCEVLQTRAAASPEVSAAHRESAPVCCPRRQPGAPARLW